MNNGAREVQGQLKLGRRVRVRCLGPGIEHSFWSDDPVRHRVCAGCKKVRAGYGAAVMRGENLGLKAGQSHD